MSILSVRSRVVFFSVAVVAACVFFSAGSIGSRAEARPATPADNIAAHPRPNNNAAVRRAQVSNVLRGLKVGAAELIGRIHVPNLFTRQGRARTATRDVAMLVGGGAVMFGVPAGIVTGLVLDFNKKARRMTAPTKLLVDGNTLLIASSEDSIVRQVNLADNSFDNWFSGVRAVGHAANSNNRYVLTRTAHIERIPKGNGSKQFGYWRDLDGDVQGLAANDTYIYTLISGGQQVLRANANDLQNAIHLGGPQFSRAQDLALDANGYLYVADTDSQHVKILDSELKVLGQFAASGADAIAVSKTGSIFVTNTAAGKVTKFTPQGNTVAEIDGATIPGGLKNPHGVAVDNAGNIFIADTDNNRVVKLDPAGNYLTELTDFNK